MQNETFTMPDASADGVRSLYLKITSAVSLTCDAHGDTGTEHGVQGLDH
jgi:hypothetical protein